MGHGSGSQATLSVGRGRQERPSKRTVTPPGAGPPAPPGCTQHRPWSAGPCLGDPGLPRPIPHPASRWDREREGHASARHIPARPPCPHAHGCQLEQKTHPQVAISNRAGPGPSADDRLWALLRPACRPLRGRGGWAHPSTRGLPACPCLPPVPPQGHTPHLRPEGPGRRQGPQAHGAGLWPGVRKQWEGVAGEAPWPRIQRRCQLRAQGWGAGRGPQLQPGLHPQSLSEPQPQVDMLLWPPSG